MPKCFNLFDLDEEIQILNIGASVINEKPYYQKIMDLGWGHLNAFDGDARQMKAIQEYYSSRATLFNQFIFDGSAQTVYLTAPETGMSSLFKPDTRALSFYNGFEDFGRVHSTEEVQTTRLDDIDDLPLLDMAQLDIQGAELTALKNGTEKLKNCLAVQLEVSFVSLYEHQPSFGEVDVYMRSQGFLPHRFFDVKRWSIKPTIINGNFRIPGNQLLEADIVYIKDPLHLERLSNSSLKKLAVIAHYSLQSVDLCGWCLLEMEKREVLPKGSYFGYLTEIQSFV